jgi:predicted nuclease of predicted toxin-antitoxin system
MKVKLDENLGNKGKEIFFRYGHDVSSVSDQKLESTPDDDLIKICNQEQRCIVSLDLDFSNVLVYKPSKYTGIAVIRLPKNSGTDVLYEMVETLAQKMKEVNIQGKLWIVQKNGIREYQEDF